MAIAVAASAGAKAKPFTQSEIDGRANTIARTRKQLEAEVDEHGGWEKWNASLSGFRGQLQQIRKGKWPWKSKHEFRFLGRAVGLAFVESLDQQPAGKRPYEAIVAVDRQLKAMGVHLILMPIPDKFAVYPDYLSEKAPKDRVASPAVKRLLLRLCEADVEVVDLHPHFVRLREVYEKRDSGIRHIYYDRDSHWRNVASACAGQTVGGRLNARYSFAGANRGQGKPRFTTKLHRRTDGNKADLVSIVIDGKTGKRYYDSEDSPVLLTGDSFSMYNMHLGGHLSAHVAGRIGQPVSFLCREGLSRTMPVELARRPGLLKGKKVVIWTFATRFLVRDPWPVVRFSPASSDGPKLEGKRVTATIAAVSDAPRVNAEYPDFIRKLHLKKAVLPDGKPVGDGKLVALAMAMQGRKLLAPGKYKPGQKVTLLLTSWSAVRDRYEKIETGMLEDLEAEMLLPWYWAVPAE